MNGLIQSIMGLSNNDVMPAVTKWLSYATPIADNVRSKLNELSGDNLLNYTIERNVLQQVENLKTFPSVKDALDKNQLRVHSWVYQLETGEVMGHDPETDTFVSLDKVKRQKLADHNRAETHTVHGSDISI
jgi:carbonic anhydrase